MFESFGPDAFALQAHQTLLHLLPDHKGYNVHVNKRHQFLNICSDVRRARDENEPEIESWMKSSSSSSFVAEAV